MTAECPQCKASIPEDIPRIGELLYTCECGNQLDGNKLREVSGMLDKPAKGKRSKS